MMSAFLNVESYACAVGRDVLVKTACTPRIKLPIRENGVGHSHEVLFVVEATEVTQGPVIVWSQSIGILAHLGVRIKVKCLFNEHGVGAVADWHGQLVASQDIPAVAIKVTGSLPVREVGARVLAGVVEVDVRRLGKGREELLFASSKSTVADLFLFNLMNLFDGFVLGPKLLRDRILEVLELVLNPVPLINWLVRLCSLKLFSELLCILSGCGDVSEGLDGLLDGPCWHGFEERGRVGIVRHSHVQVAVHVV